MTRLFWCDNYKFSREVAFSFFNCIDFFLGCVGVSVAFLLFSPSVSLDHIYTFCDANSLWGMGYGLEQKTPVGFVSPFDENLIRLVGVQNATDSANVFL